ncbi:ComF family protein [Hydrogenovibrio sp. 3SP14C1]|uniref:ComF family protein n=1 Tax=Hydrogenovibrio sp. 3SP14C1 TaxID=3038774 RepID=UPI002416317F|nr:ComF family protein [Hydrogenovibrio sp. 3SP14C1]MDG4811404.1 ComF family protein [Hydrogenovibrio sp. 3SP14C1]
MNRFEKWLFPPVCTLTDQKGQSVDLAPELLQKMTRPAQCCPVCAEKMPVAQVCGSCLVNPPAFYRTQAAFYYESVAQDLIHALKFQQQLYVSRLLAELWVDNLEIDTVEAIIPVPLHASRLLERGFNQSLELAKQVSKMTGIPVLPTVVHRLKATSSQAMLNAQARQQNVKGAFSLNQRSFDELAKVKEVALLDDVMTTGATLNQLALTLKRAYPHLKIQAWVVAKATSKMI